MKGVQKLAIWSFFVAQCMSGGVALWMSHIGNTDGMCVMMGIMALATFGVVFTTAKSQSMQ